MKEVKMEKQKNSQAGKLIICAFIYLVLGYGFAHYLALVSWLSSKSSGSGYYEYYINGIRTSGGGPLAMFIFFFLGIVVPVLAFSFILGVIDKVMSKKRKLPNGIEDRNEYFRVERESSNRSYYTATFVLTIIFAVFAVIFWCCSRYTLRIINPNARFLLSPRQPEYWFVFGGHISRGAVIICSLFAMWGANAHGKPKNLLHFGTISIIIAIVVNLLFDFNAIRNTIFINPRFFTQATQSFIYILAVVIIMLLRKNNSTKHVLTVFLSIGVLLFSALIPAQFRINVFDFLLSSQNVPLIFLSVVLAFFGHRIDNTGRLFN